jgi:hypothetical protein
MFHAAALGIMLNPVLRLTGQLETWFLPVTWLVVRITWWLIVIHLVEITLWALFFWWHKWRLFGPGRRCHEYRRHLNRVNVHDLVC